MEELQQKLLDKLKIFKGITETDSDGVFSFALETIIYDILDYCHFEIEEWPVALDNTAVLMADELHEESIKLSSEGEVKSLAEGDFSITKETNTDIRAKLSASPSFAKDYKRNLNRYRKLVR